MKIRFILFLCWCLFVLPGLKAQRVIASQGQYYENTDGSIAFTLGEPIIETYTVPFAILTQGFQQPILYVNALDKHFPPFFAKVFPNPVEQYLHIDLEIKGFPYDCSLFDMSGKLLKKSQIMDAETILPMKTYADGTYLLVLTNSQTQQTQTFKVLKK